MAPYDSANLFEERIADFRASLVRAYQAVVGEAIHDLWFWFGRNKLKFASQESNRAKNATV